MGLFFINHRCRILIIFVALVASLRAQTTTVPWSSYAHDPQHTGLSTIGAQRLERIKWSTPIDLLLAGTSGELFIHYGSPVITAGNTVLVPVRTGNDSFRMEAHSGSNGTLLYTLPTDFTAPPHTWYPSYSPALSQGTRMYYPGAGGTVYYRDQLDSSAGPSGQIAFYGNSLYAANQSAFAGSVAISTPITADANGNIYFGFDVTGSNPANLTSGLARIAPDGSGSWISASAAAQGDTNIVEVAENCAPALSIDGSMVYVSVSQGPVGTGSSGSYLVSLNSTTLAPLARIRLTDPETGTDAQIPDVSSASPTVGPDGDVYYGAFEHVCCSNNDRGWLLHFDKNLTTVKIPGAFGWDTTPSVVPARLVPTYSGTSAYLLFTKYNNYAGIGTGNGMNKIAVLDPNASMTDPVTGTTVMKEVISILGATLDPPGNTNGSVREWCINSGAIDPFSAAAIANSEDGTLYRWDFASNSFLQRVNLTAGVGEAYTPTAIGADGTAYAINDGYLFAVGQASNLTVTSSHIGNFSQGQSGATYTLTATNSGTAATNGIVTVTDSLPAGLTATAIGGVGWACTQPAGPCTRSDTLLPGISYPAITLTVNVASNAPSAVINTVNISSDGAANSVNSTANDSTAINLMPQLSIVSTHSGNFSQGQAGAVYSVTVSNSAAGGPTNGSVAVTDLLPSGLTLVSMSGSGWNCAASSCTTSVVLNPGASYPVITVAVNVGGSAPLTVSNQVSVSGGDSSTATGSDSTNVTPGPLTITTFNPPWVTQYQSYSTTLTATGGVYPYTWSVLSSTGVSLPEGMTLDPSSGVISATQVNGQGGYEFTVQVTDNASPTPHTATQVLDIGVNSDASFAGCQMFPPDSIYNQRIDGLPVDVNPEHQIAAGFLSASLHPDFGHGFYPGPGGIPWMRVPANQPLTTENLAFDGQIQPAGIYHWPVPPWPYAVVEGTAFGQDGPDHHILILQTSTNSINGPQNGACTLYETYQNSSVPGDFNAATNTWSLSSGVAYNLNTDGIASSIDMLDSGAQDSAGVPIVPLLLRYSEVPLGALHPLRITFPSPTNWFIWPGTGCCAGSGPPQGLLYRLKASANWQAACPVSTNPQAATFLQALQQYGAYMSDHGAAGYVQGVPDVRWNDNDLACIKKFTVNDLEVVDNSALEVSAISGQTRPYVLPATLPVFTVGTPYSTVITEVGGNPATLQRTLSSGSLPPGLLLNPATATIAGTPTSSAGSPYHFGIVATDTTSGLPSAEQQFTLTITALPAPDLTVLLSHFGDFMQGESGATYNINVINSGNAATTGTVTVVDSLQPGVTATAISGTGWTCTLSTVSCSRSDALAAGGSYPVTVTGTIGYSVPFLSTNVATVSGGGEVVTSNDGSSDLTISFQLPGWLVTSTHTGNFMPGQSGATYTLTLTNIGGTSSGGTVTIVDTLPAGLTATAMGGTGWSCTLATRTCTRSDALVSAGTYAAITLTVNVTTNLPALVTNHVSVSGGGAQPATGGDPTAIGLTPLLSIAKSHTGSFTLGQAGAMYSVVVGNSAASIPTTAPVTVTETIPTGLTLISMAGDGWDCSAVTSCTRGDPLNGGLSYSTITATVNVSQSAPSQMTNRVTVTGGGSVSANAQDVTSIALESQTITFATLPNEPYGTAPFTLTATASSNLTVSFGTTSTSCSVSATTVTLVAVGACTIQAMQPGNTQYAAAPPVSQTFQVTAATATLSISSLSFPNTVLGKSSPVQTVSLQNLGNTPLTVTSILPAGTDAANYQYTADAAHPCPVSPATLAAGASCTLDVAFVPISQGAHSNAQLAITDNSGNQTGVIQTVALSGTGIVLSSIAVTANSGSILYSGTEQFTATGTYSDTSTADLTRLAVWSSSVPAIASISATGIASAAAVGQTNIVAALGGVTSNVFLLTVATGPPATVSISSGSTQSAALGATFALPLQALVKDAVGNVVANAAVTFTAPSGAGGTFANGQSTYTTTTNSAGLATSTIFTANSTPGSYLVTASVTGVSAPASFSMTNLKPAALTIVKTHTGTFAQGQSGAAYAVTVANALGAGVTAGIVTVTETVPSGLTLVSMNGGATWNCSVLPVCTTNAVLSPGSSYPGIAVTVNVASNAAFSLTNQVSVSGGGSATAFFNDPATIASVSPCDINVDGSANVSDVQLVINEALGISSTVNDLNQDGVVNVADIQIVINAALGLGCSGS